MTVKADVAAGGPGPMEIELEEDPESYDALVITRIDGVDVRLGETSMCNTSRPWWLFFCFWCDEYSCTVDDLGKGEHTLTLSKVGYPEIDANVFGPPDTTIRVEMKETRTTVRGIVTDGRQEAMAGLPVMMMTAPVEGGPWKPLHYDWTTDSGEYLVRGECFSFHKARANLTYSPSRSHFDIPVHIYDYNTQDTAYSETDAMNLNVKRADMTVRGSEGGEVYSALQHSYEFWKDKGEAEKVEVFINRPITAVERKYNATTAWFCPNEVPWEGPDYGLICNETNEIHFTPGYMRGTTAAHEYAHAVSRGWGLSKGHNVPEPRPVANIIKPLTTIADSNNQGHG